MEELELVSFKIISAVGAAKSLFIESMMYSNKFDFSRAKELIEEGETYRIKGHEAHFDLIQKEANGENILVNLILMHAEDQLMSTEVIKILAEQLILSYEIIYNLQNKMKE